MKSSTDSAETFRGEKDAEEVKRIGPILFFRGHQEERLELAALIVRPEAEAPPAVTAGDAAIYTAQRNFLMLQRRAGRWRAWWELEQDGPTPPLEFDP